jgi:4-aminobutyrate aminotransferase-like enzyme/Ser/Thr protein kinase RdoA (MazF antagonist)
VLKRDVEVDESQGVLESPAPAFSSERAAEFAREIFGIRGSAEPLGSERDQNFRICPADSFERDDPGGASASGYVLKIPNQAESPAALDLQQSALTHVSMVAPHLAIPRLHPTLDGARSHSVPGADGAQHSIWLLSYLPGRQLGDVRPSARLHRALGAAIAHLARALRGFFHPAAGRELLWDLKHASKLRPHLDAISDPASRRWVEEALDRFDAGAASVLPTLRSQVIHSDANSWNVLVDAADDERIAGIIDFGDIVHSALINDVGIALATTIVDLEAPIEAACEVVAGYHAVTPLQPEELDILFELWLARLAAEVSIAAWRSKSHPENVDYITGSAAECGFMLERLLELEPDAAPRAFRAACKLDGAATPSRAPSPRRESNEQMIARRTRLLGPAYSLFYDRPVQIVRGEGVWLYDETGRRYLDAYNNVAHVGHGHPHVVDAIAEQARTPNTNTRYLNDKILEYATRLGATLPGDLEVCMFVCTGSEANDLAWRLAKAHTGAGGGIVIEYAYHGSTEAVSWLTPSEWPPGTEFPQVQTLAAPDEYRGPFRSGEPEIGHRYAELTRGAIEGLRSAGFELSSFFCDTAFSTHGILVPPDSYLKEVFALVRESGGLCVADEVQAGFGRMGTAMWGFETFGVTPDIVTLGKPMGNGHPLAAVVTTPEIAADFGDRLEYFNTFGGNPVSCAAGLAVLDVLEREGLQSNAERVGSYMKAKLVALGESHPAIGDVRGAGLFIGVDLVCDRATREPAPDLARRVANGMRESGVLIGIDGPAANVLKIRPPMPIQEEHADLLVASLDAQLGQH